MNLFDADVIDTSELLTHEKTTNAGARKDNVLQKYLAIVLVLNANKAKYESLWNKLENDLLVGTDSYPTSIGAATHLLTNWKAPAPSQPNPNPRNTTTGGGRDRERTSGVTFAQIPLPANDNFSSLPGYDPARPTMAPSRKPLHNISDRITCTRCHKPGHYATTYPFNIPAPQLFQSVFH